jgi:hypothetical protein
MWDVRRTTGHEDVAAFEEIWHRYDCMDSFLIRKIGRV